MDKLKPCPFCGSDSIKVASKKIELRQNEQTRQHRHMFYATCNKCHSRGKPIRTGWLSFNSQTLTYTEEAIQVWNKRKVVTTCRINHKT